MENRPIIAILRWEQGLVPEGLLQLEAMPGNSTNPDTYPFPIKMVEVSSACVETVITNPSQKLLQDMVSIVKELKEKDGIRAVTTSCGFNAIFQRQLADSVDIPVLTSSLLQVPFVHNLIGKEKSIGIITANKSSLTTEHMRACGITEDMKTVVFGLEKAKEWGTIFDNPDQKFDEKIVEQEIIATAKEGIREFPEIGAIVLECTDLPPFAKKISEATGLPVFDYTTMIGYAALALGQINMY